MWLRSRWRQPNIRTDCLFRLDSLSRVHFVYLQNCRSVHLSPFSSSSSSSSSSRTFSQLAPKPAQPATPLLDTEQDTFLAHFPSQLQHLQDMRKHGVAPLELEKSYRALLKQAATKLQGSVHISTVLAQILRDFSHESQVQGVDYLFALEMMLHSPELGPFPIVSTKNGVFYESIRSIMEAHGVQPTPHMIFLLVRTSLRIAGKQGDEEFQRCSYLLHKVSAELEPDNFLTLINESYWWASEQRFEVPTWASFVDLDPKVDQGITHRTLLLANMGRSFLAPLETVTPVTLNLSLLLLDVYCSLGRAADAEAQAEALILMDVTADEDRSARMVKSLFSAGLTAPALDVLARLEEKQTLTDPAILHFAVHWLSRLGQPDGALAVYQASTRFEVRDPTCLVSIGKAFGRSPKHDLVELIAAVAQNPGNLIDFFVDEKRLDHALFLFRACIPHLDTRVWADKFLQLLPVMNNSAQFYSLCVCLTAAHDRGTPFSAAFVQSCFASCPLLPSSQSPSVLTVLQQTAAHLGFPSLGDEAAFRVIRDSIPGVKDPAQMAEVFAEFAATGVEIPIDEGLRAMEDVIKRLHGRRRAVILPTLFALSRCAKPPGAAEPPTLEISFLSFLVDDLQSPEPYAGVCESLWVIHDIALAVQAPIMPHMFGIIEAVALTYEKQHRENIAESASITAALCRISRFTPFRWPSTRFVTLLAQHHPWWAIGTLLEFMWTTDQRKSIEDLNKCHALRSHILPVLWHSKDHSVQVAASEVGVWMSCLPNTLPLSRPLFLSSFPAVGLAQLTAAENVKNLPQMYASMLQCCEVTARELPTDPSSDSPLRAADVSFAPALRAFKFGDLAQRIFQQREFLPVYINPASNSFVPKFDSTELAVLEAAIDTARQTSEGEGASAFQNTIVPRMCEVLAAHHRPDAVVNVVRVCQNLDLSYSPATVRAMVQAFMPPKSQHATDMDCDRVLAALRTAGISNRTIAQIRTLMPGRAQSVEQ